MKKSGSHRSVLMIVENLPVPFDRRVWQEACALKEAGYTVSVICPKGKGFDTRYEAIEGIHIYRHALPFEASGPAGFLLEYATALFWEFFLSWKILRRHGFNAIHACNPPDLIFLVSLFYKTLFRKKFLFDHHDICPELYEAKTGRRGFIYGLLLFLERCTFRCADASIATNETFKEIAKQRGGMAGERVWVVRSYPDLRNFRRLPADPILRNGRKHLVGYVGIMAVQDGVDVLIRAMDFIVHVEGREDVHCLIVGDGPEKANLEVLSGELRLQSYITFTGFLSGEDLLTHLSSIDVGIIPDPCNPYNDKISMNKVYEYMMLGIPIVQFDLRESRSMAVKAALNVCENSPSAFGKALLELVDNPARRKTMSRYGIACASRRLNWDREKAKLLEAYDALFA